MKYRRVNIPGACYFFTVNIVERNKSLLIDHIEDLRTAFKEVKQNHSFVIEAIVILPDHLHTIWRMPINDAAYPMRWKLIKSSFSRALPKTEHISKSRKKKGERGIWQRRYWEHLIKDDRDYECHVDYIHFNPVKHGYAQSPADWRYSSIHHYIRKNAIPSNWAAVNDFDGEFGEV